MLYKFKTAIAGLGVITCAVLGASVISPSLAAQDKAKDSGDTAAARQRILQALGAGDFDTVRKLMQDAPHQGAPYAAAAQRQDDGQ